MSESVIDRIRAHHASMPPGEWFWRLGYDRLELLRRHPVLRGWRSILSARRLGTNGATLEVMQPDPDPMDPADPWEDGSATRVTRATDIRDFAVLEWIASSPLYVRTLLEECDRLPAELATRESEISELGERLQKAEAEAARLREMGARIASIARDASGALSESSGGQGVGPSASYHAMARALDRIVAVASIGAEEGDP